MPYFRKNSNKEPRKSRRCTEKTLDNVISIRINDDEKRRLERLLKKSSKSISEVMREALELWGSKRRNLCLD
jgi:hypothetical protein